VLIVSAFVLPHVGGVEVIVEQQASSLAEAGFDVTVVTSDAGETTASSGADGYRVVRNRAWNGLERRWGVPYPIWRVRDYLRLRRLVRESDVVHVHDVTYLSSLCGALFARRARRPLLITQHVAVVAHDSGVVTAVQRAVYRTWGRLVWRWAAHVICYNPIVRQFLVRSGVDATKIVLTYNGIDTTYFSPGDSSERNKTRARYGLPADKPIVLFVGRLVPKKGVERLIDARDPAYEVVLVGSGVVPALPDGVVCLGPVDRAELRDLYRAADVFAFPAVGEMLTLVMQEAMACGLPVVATHMAEYAAYEFGPDDLVLVPPEAAPLQRAIKDLLGDDASMSRLRASARRVAEERFDWKSNAERMAALYERAGRGTRQPRGSTPAPQEGGPAFGSDPSPSHED
jgi:glycosyltransferase involved in cell wall biosynthesis